MEQAPLEAIHPYPVVTHPLLYASHNASVLLLVGASVHATTLHDLPLATPLHFPSDPFLFAHTTSSPVSVEQLPKGDLTQP